MTVMGGETETYQLRFGDIDFSPQAQTGEVEYRVYGIKRGRPVPVTTVANSMMQDGEAEVVTGYTNRDQQIVIGMRSADSAALASAERALWLEAQKSRNELAWTPMDDLGVETVFDVLWCDMSGVDERDNWDIFELNGYRVYTLTIRALPYGRSETEQVFDALASGASATSTTIADGTSATNWTGTGSVTASGGSLQQTVTTTDRGKFSSDGDQVFYTSSASWTYTPASPLDFSSESYLTFDYDPPGIRAAGSVPSVKVFADGTPCPRVDGADVGGTFSVPDASVSVLVIEVEVKSTQTAFSPPSTAVHKLDNVVKSNQAPNLSTTGRESVRTVDVLGSARTQVRLTVSGDATALGTTIIYTAPALLSAVSAYQPPMRRFKTAGGTDTTDVQTMTGKRSQLTSGTTTFNVPAGGLPRGTYALMGRVRMLGSANATGKVTWTVGTRSGSTLYGSKNFTSPSLSLLGSAGTTAAIFKVVTLGMVTLPIVDVPPESSATVEFGTFDWTGTGEVSYDDLFLFWLGDGAGLSVVDAGTFTRLWLDPATLTTGRPAVWVGTQDDRTDAVHAGQMSNAWGIHNFDAGPVNIFCATTTAANPAISGRYPPRWHTHAENIESDD